MDDYLHRIEYKRRLSSGALVCEHVETVSDHGWYVVKGDRWKDHYTRGCAAEFLDRVHAASGTFVVVVWRADARVCTTRFEWECPSGG